jgi:hypothetical protein
MYTSIPASIYVLESAQRNFSDAASTLGLGSDFRAVLLLTESQGTNYFSRFLQQASNGSSVGGWEFQSTAESDSLLAISPSEFELTFIAGRQIVTAERLEVLAVCANELFDDGGTIPNVIDSVSAADGIAIVPWGFGKWTGHRKNVINRLIDEFSQRSFQLGDNSGRISLWREPPQFERARQREIGIFRGTDPLPFPGHEKRIGRFGFSINGPFNRTRPAASMRKLLATNDLQPASYGALESPIAFARNQLAMQAQKWRRKFRSGSS